ncbi:MAG: amidohydrolase family protein [Planctomycetes bacterium]|nr:amidohydrolase family protein [Planctomycetota bacterium]
MLDIVIRNGTLIDGTGSLRRAADVGIASGRIEAVGSLAQAAAAREIDAAGKIVAPGFIDVHNHSDGWLIRERHFTPKTAQGFTTDVLMADGIGYAPVNEHTVREWLFYLRSLNGLRMSDWTGWETFEGYLEAIDGHTAQNAASHLPYANLRALACGFGSGRVDDFQMREIQRQVVIGMEAGAVGVSTGLDYISQCFSTTDELVEALTPMSPYSGLYVTHIRYKKGLLPGIQEAVEIGRRAGIPVHISHLKGQSPGEVERVLEYIDKTARHEVEFSYDAYPYQPGSTMLNYLLPTEIWDQGPLAVLGRLNDPMMRKRFADGLEAQRVPVDKLHIAWVLSDENRHLLGKTLEEVIEESGRSAADALLDLLIEERLATLLVFDEGDDVLIEPLIQHDLFALGTDGIYMPEGPVHPRVYGSVGRILGRLVREKKLLSLEQAIHHFSGFSAQKFGLIDRGEIVEGKAADVVVFDEATVTDPATFEEPHQTTTGFDAVLVNGVPVIENGSPVDFQTPPGQFLRRGDKSS